MHAKPAQATGVGLLMGILAGLLVVLGLGIAEAIFQVISEGSQTIYVLIGVLVVFYVDFWAALGHVTLPPSRHQRRPEVGKN